MSTPAYVQLVDTDTASEPEGVPLGTEESQPLGSRVPFISVEFEASEPSGTRTVSSHSSFSSDSTAPLSTDHPLTHASPTPTPTRVSFHHKTACMAVRTHPTLSPGMSARIAGIGVHLSSLRILRVRAQSQILREKEGSEDESLDLDDERGSHSLDDEGQGLDDKGQRLEEEGPVASEPLGLGYRAARRHAHESTEEIAPSTYEVGQSSRVYTDTLTYAPPAAPIQTLPFHEWSSSSVPVSPSSPVVPSPIASPVATSTATILVDEDQFLEVGAQLELDGSILHDHTQRLDALPPTLFEGYDSDLKELYTTSGAVRDEIFS
nr:hypothetical protein [Tanacetum cinerariifolium]